MSPIATEPVYTEDRLGIKRLVAAPGDVIPDPSEVPDYGIVTPRNPAASVAEPVEGYAGLSEDAVMALLPTLSDEQVEAVRDYEAAHQARGSIVTFGRTSKPVDLPKKRARKGKAQQAPEQFGDGPGSE